MADWRYAMASAIGTSHASTGAPCQDACACEIVQDAEGRPVLLAVVSDGAGSATYSHIGSATACAEAIRLLSAHFALGLTVPDLTKDVCAEIVLGIQTSLLAAADSLAVKLRDVACTLLLAVVGETHAAFTQIGDGVIVALAGGDEDHSWVFWPERGEYANTTVFLSQSDVVDHLQHHMSSPRVHEVGLMTDGIQCMVLDWKTKTAHGPYFRTMFSPLRREGLSGEQRDLSTLLAGHLNSDRVNGRTDDDKTLLLASRYPVL